MAVVRRLGAVQAQDYRASLWAVGVRMRAGTEADVEQAIAEARIVRTWPMRGTLHLLAAEDVRWMQRLLAPRVVARDQARHEREYGLDARELRRCRKAVEKILGDGRPMSRPELYRALEDAGIATADSRGLHICGRLAHDGLICGGPREGAQPTFVLCDAWLPATGVPGRDEALALLASRYIAGHGPATAHDLAWWSGLTVKQARAALASVSSQLQTVDAGGATYWQTGDASPAARSRSVQLLPAYDEYLLGYKDRSPVLDPAHHRRVFSVNGIIHPCVVVDGQVAGLCPRSTGQGGASMALDLFRPLSDAEQHGVRTAAKRYAHFLGRPADVIW
ncbi:winged helix DNA-binding domain-containing protein [Luteimonas suaedae]|uniref:winged helix DNA-binding domain-containing protein n=1 Tax=Luteimonas suaedae TaxID=2605430 RepID=UPI0016596E71|nr:winged helix DNA-binding domain-containing protein [Luteimonas suaedae]